MFGYYMISLYEVGTMYRLSDENVLSILVLPKPVILSTTMQTFVTTISDAHFPRQLSS
jgi:hypothetical protein